MFPAASQPDRRHKVGGLPVGVQSAHRAVLLPAGEAVRLRLLCAGVARAAEAQVAGGDAVLDGTRGYLAASLRTGGTVVMATTMAVVIV